jgi:hypothetical protein
MVEIKLDVIGVIPPCPRCKQTENNAINAAAKLNEEGVTVLVNKLDITSKETISKYGIVASPAIAINGVVKIMGQVPSVAMIERVIKAEVNIY